MDGGVRDIVFAELAEFILWQFVQDARIAVAVADLLAPAQAVGQRQDVGQLKCAVDLAVRGENLLDQG